MKNERWQEVERLYHLAMARDPDERSAFLEEACRGDKELRREVESLVAYEPKAKDFIEAPALEFAAKMMADEHSKTVIGQTINQYKIISPLGAGGMGEVYLAEDTRLRRKVALKFLPLLLTQDKAHLRRFELEARAVAALSHPNVCTIHEVIQTREGRHCIVIEYVEGITLRDRMTTNPLKMNEAVDIAIQIASALSAAHAAGIVHRDIKPENVMLRADGYVKVLDFGLAKLTEKADVADSQNETRPIELKTTPGVLMGTVGYMSPEQARGLPVDARTDIWSLGVVLYELVAGRKPFDGPTPTDIIISIAEREPAALSQSAPEAVSLEPVITKALAKDRRERYQTAQEVLTDLKDVKRAVEVGADFERHLTRPEASKREKAAFRFGNFVTSRNGILVAAVVVLAVAGLVWTLWLRHGSPAAVPATEIRSLAVLPMLNLSGDPSQDYFAEGMTETLIAGVAKVTDLRVTSRTSVMQFKGSPKPIKEIAQALGVDGIIEGSVQRFGDNVRVHVTLIHAATDQVIWNHNYERDLHNVLAFQNEVAGAVAQAIQIKLTPQQKLRLETARRIDPAAYDEFLRGKFYLNRQTKADNAIAIEALGRAVSIDPNFAAAWAELAQAYVWKLFLFTPEDKSLELEAFRAVDKALKLDADLPEAYLARGRLLWTPANHFPHDTAIQEYRHALALNPSLDEARNQLALVLGHVGLLDEALAELNKALAANPNNNLARFRIGEVLLFQGKDQEALTALQNLPPEVNPSLIGHQIVLALFDLGRKQEAEAALEKFLKDYPEDNRGLFTSLQALLLASDGQDRLAEEKIKLAIDRGKGFGHFHHTAYHIACAYAVMNKPEESLKWLESAANDGFPCYALFLKDHKLDNLRQHARFKSLMEKLKQQSEYYKTVFAR